MPSYAALKAEYGRLWNETVIRPAKANQVTAIATKLIGLKPRYQAVEKRTGVPWFLVAAWHERESAANFHAQLAQGDPLNVVSTNVPKGRGPFATWEDSAYDALVTLKQLDKVKDWCPERACFESERYNGFGYRNNHPTVLSPYLWSFTLHYTRGKYVSDGRFSATTVDAQCGVVPVVKRIMELDKDARWPGQVPVTQPTVITTSGGILASIANSLGASPETVLGIIVAGIAVAIAAGVITYVRSRKR
jgi:lysozyme family protein